MSKFPIQKISTSSKTKRWFRDCVIEGVKLTLNERNSIKPSNDIIIDNYNIYDGERNTDDMKKSFDPLSSINPEYKPVFKSFSTIRDRINELVGEYIERGTEYIIAAIDRDAVSSKLKEHKDKVSMIVAELIQDESIKDDEEIKYRLEKALDFKFLSKAEVTANKVLNYYKTDNRVKYLEIEGFLDALVTAVSVFDVYIENNKLIVDKVNPKSVFAVRNGDSNNLQDSELISVISYMPKTKIIDKYGESMSIADVKKLFDDRLTSISDAKIIAENKLVFDNIEELNNYTKNITSSTSYQAVTDNNGNIRVVRFKWKGFRKVYRRKYYGVNGEVSYDFVSDKYKPNRLKGEELTERWIVEWHEAVLIGNDIVVNARVSPYQYRDLKSINVNTPTIVGRYFNSGGNVAKSLVDIVKPYLYFRDFVFAKIEDLISKNIGKAIEIDVDTFPENWKVDKVLYYLKRFSISVKSSMAEGKKGRAKGKIAGAYSTGTRVLDAELGAGISYLTNLLVVIDDMIARVTGVTNQRLGAIHSRELVGNVERSRVQSSLITEILFVRYEQLILDLYSTIIEAAKQVADKDDRLQYVLDDNSFGMLTDGINEFKNTKFGLFPVNSKKYDKIKSIIEQSAVNAIPNGSMTVSQLISLYDGSSTVDMIDKQYQMDKDRERNSQMMEQRKEELRIKELQLQQKHTEYVASMEAKFNQELEKIKGDYKLLIESSKQQDKALSETAKMLLDIDKNKVVQEYNNAKLELERQIAPQNEQKQS